MDTGSPSGAQFSLLAELFGYPHVVSEAPHSHHGLSLQHNSQTSYGVAGFPEHKSSCWVLLRPKPGTGQHHLCCILSVKGSHMPAQVWCGGGAVQRHTYQDTRFVGQLPQLAVQKHFCAVLLGLILFINKYIVDLYKKYIYISYKRNTRKCSLSFMKSPVD